MAHEIDTTVNEAGAAVFAREAAWHGLGTVLDHPFTSEEALQIAGLDFTVEKRSLFVQTVSGQADVADFVATVRTDTEAVLGVVGPDYVPMQNRTAFAAFDEVLREHGAVYETAGSLRGGKRIFLAAKLPETFKVTGAVGDEIEEYLLGFNAHDGSGAIWALPTSIRPVCANTVGAALGFGFSVARAKLAKGRALKVRHSGDAEGRLKSAKEVFEAAHKRTLAAVENAQRLADMTATDRMVQTAVEATLDEFIPPAVQPHAVAGRTILQQIMAANDKFAKAEDRQKAKRAEAGKAILDLVMAEFQLVGKNAWGLYNGCTEYTDHKLVYRGANAAENRFQSLISGRVDDFKGELITQIVNAAAA